MPTREALCFREGENREAGCFFSVRSWEMADVGRREDMRRNLPCLLMRVMGSHHLKFRL